MLVSEPASSNLPDRSPKQVVDGRSTSETPSAGSAPGISPGSIDAPFTAGRARVPAKRARKAINCGPCRSSKHKCDRKRPCSSCKLRGTTTSCSYQDQDGEPRAVSRTDVPSDARSVNSTMEFSRIRNSLALIEAQVISLQGSALSGSVPPHQPSPGASITPGRSQFHESLLISDQSEPEAAPGARGQSNRDGLYAGPTSTVSHLTLGVRDGNDAPEAAENTSERTLDVTPAYNSDLDLCNQLPNPSVIDDLVGVYFDCCNWVYRNVNERAFMAAWASYKSGTGSDRIVLATVCMIMALVILYLPTGHDLLCALPPDSEALFYKIMHVALERKQAEGRRAYSLELVELLLIRVHYLMTSKIDHEELWRVLGEVVNTATAMGLHRDPGKEVLSEVAERRRWAWWNIIALERWHAFTFGRPITIASHHFDTRVPSYDPSRKLCEVNIHIFRLAFILGNIMDDAVSLRRVPYESVLAKDRALQEWWAALPKELDLDDYTVVSLLPSPITSKRHRGVMSVVVRAAYLHIRFAMHRRYAGLAHGETSKYATSLEIAINSADKLIMTSTLGTPEMISQAGLGVTGHLNWAPMHCFSAAIFFCFQIINNPEQAGAKHLCASVLRAVTTLESCRGMRAAEKALNILRALGPLYTEEYLSDRPEDRDHKKEVILPTVRRLQFPCVDSPNVRIEGAATGSGAGSSPAQSGVHADSPGSGAGPDQTPPPHPSVQGTAVHLQEADIMSMPPQAPSAPMLQPQYPACENLGPFGWSTNFAVGGPAQYMPVGQGQQLGYPAAMQQYQNAAENDPAMWRSAAHHAPTSTMVHPEAAASDPLYADYQMTQQDPYAGVGVDLGGSAVDVRMGLGDGTVGELWGAGASGFMPGEWAQMYTGLRTYQG